MRDERVPDLLVNPDNSDGGPAFTRAYAQIDKIKTPGIRAIATLNAVAAGPVNADGIVDLDGLDNESAMTPTDGAMFHTVDRGDVVAGRYPDVNNAAEVMINEAKARRDHLRVGDTMRLGVMAVNDIDTKHPDAPPRPRFIDDFRVVGIVRVLDEATRAKNDPQLTATLMFTPALNRRLAGVTPLYTGKEVTLDGGAAAVPQFETKVRDLFKGVTVKDPFTGEIKPVNMNFQEVSSLTVARARRASRPYVLALWFFAVLAALAALAVVGQAIIRSMRPFRAERSAWNALGLTRSQTLGCAALRGLIVGSLGAAFAFAGAAVASRFFPIGPLRSVEPNRGIQFDWLVLGLGLALLVVGITCIGMLAMRTRRPREPRAAAALGDQLARSGTPIPIVSGVRFALDRGRDASVPVVSTLIGIIVAIAALVATMVYGAGLNRFVETPTRYGFPWNYQVLIGSDNNSPDPGPLATSRDIKAFAPGRFSQFSIKGKSVAAVGIDRLPGVSFLPLLEGTAPQADDEIVLGAKTMAALHADVGDTIPVVGQQNRTKDFRVVGTAVFPRSRPIPGRSQPVSASARQRPRTRLTP